MPSNDSLQIDSPPSNPEAVKAAEKASSGEIPTKAEALKRAEEAFRSGYAIFLDQQIGKGASVIEINVSHVCDDILYRLRDELRKKNYRADINRIATQQKGTLKVFKVELVDEDSK